MLLDHLSDRTLGYALHTNRELGLMLRGLKPLAVFAEVYGHFPDVVRRYLRMFDRHVERGALLKCEFVEVPQHLHVIMYATLGEEWRIEEMLSLRQNVGEWTDEHERTEGKLLGYTDLENEIWLSRRAS